jgi:hypothetical protein
LTKEFVWNGNWAHDCDFPGNDLKSAAISGELCGQTCYETEGCSHFTWSKHKGGTCWLKKGNVGKASAVPSNGAVCGIARSSKDDQICMVKNDKDHKKYKHGKKGILRFFIFSKELLANLL